jgi:drug/metabolite transporter (DMT)-like permease
MWRALGVALIVTAPLGLPDVLNGDWSLRPALALLALGAGGTAIANIMTATAAGRMGATKASIAAFIIPVVALLLGVAVRGERVGAVELIGAAICLAGALILRSPRVPGAPRVPGVPGVPGVPRVPRGSEGLVLSEVTGSRK